LAKRKLLPALYDLDMCGDRLIPDQTAIVGCARRSIELDKFRDEVREGLKKFSRFGVNEDCWKKFASRLEYADGMDRPEGFSRLRSRLERIEKARGLPHSRVFYLALPPESIIPTVEMLAGAGLITSADSKDFTRVVVEKPIGHNLETAIEIDNALHKFLDESQIFRIDHYLGKETVQNLMVLRFANGIFERIWNNRNIDHVQITVAESEGVGTRAGYYDHAGALRDIVQNHVLQMLALTAMEPPISLDPAAIRRSKLDVLRALRRISPSDVAANVVRGQYTAGTIDSKSVPAYLNEQGVAKNSRAETYVALKTFIDDWRWSDVPFYLRTGKCLPVRATEIVIKFKEVPEILFNRGRHLPADVMTLRIQPDEGFALQVITKRPGLGVAVGPARMNLQYATEFDGRSPEAYERLLLDVMIGDQTLFMDRDSVEESWRFVQPILDAWENDPLIPIEHYEAGSWGPKSADRLISSSPGGWHTPGI
jgi:glucose-6-phosphate 1-dehydrogenase